jgi:hypothetical protein
MTATSARIGTPTPSQARRASEALFAKFNIAGPPHPF